MVAGSIRQVAILYSNNCMRDCLAELNSHKGGHLNKFDSTSKTESTEYCFSFAFCAAETEILLNPPISGIHFCETHM